MSQKIVRTRQKRPIDTKPEKRLEVIDAQWLRNEAVKLANRELFRYRQRYGYTRTPSWFLYAYRDLVACVVELRRQAGDPQAPELLRCELAAKVYKKAIRMLDLDGFYYHRRGEDAGKKLWWKRFKAKRKKKREPGTRPYLKLLAGGKRPPVLALPAPVPEPEAAVICAWCLREIGKKKGVEGVTHGCCQSCKTRIIGELDERGVYPGAEVR